MSINPAFQGHGTFCFIPQETMDRYRTYGGEAAGQRSSAELFAQAVVDMGMSHVWVRLFGLEGTMDRRTTREAVDALRARGIHIAGWGYCHGKDARKEAQQAKDEASAHGITAFVADIEPGRELGGTRSDWREREFSGFIDDLAGTFGNDNLAISTWPVLKIQDSPAFPSRKLIRKVADRVAMFAPQAYWMSYPKAVHYNTTGFKEADYPKNDPSSFVRLVIDSWRADEITRPLLITAQAYWGEGAPEVPVLEGKIKNFAADFPDWGKIVGLNWWHAGGPKAMSDVMIDELRSAKIGDKPFHQPAPSGPVA